LLVENNEVSWNNTGNYDPNWDAGGSKIVKSSNVTFRGNNVHDNYGPGLWSDTDVVNVTYENNTLTGNAGPGIFHEASDAAVIRNNTFSRNATLTAGKSVWWGADLYLNDSKNTEIYGNTITATYNGIGLVDIDRGSTARGLLEIRNVYVHDNTIRVPAGGSNGLVGDRSTAYTSANNRFANNTYFVTSLTGGHWQWNGTRTWTQWQALGKDVTGILATV
jgi:parallel beta-helix repeat protein